VWPGALVVFCVRLRAIAEVLLFVRTEHVPGSTVGKISLGNFVRTEHVPGSTDEHPQALLPCAKKAQGRVFSAFAVTRDLGYFCTELPANLQTFARALPRALSHELYLELFRTSFT